MSHVLDRLGFALLDATLVAIAISGLVILAMVQCRQPARRRSWARAGLISTLALLPLSAMNPFPRIDLQGPLRSLLPIGLDEPPPRPPRTGDGRDRSSLVGSIGDASADLAREGAGPGWTGWIGRGMVLGYLVGVSVGLGSILLGVVGSAWLVRRGWLPSEESIGLFESQPFGGRTSRPRLVVSDRVSRAVLVGTFRPVVLIPVALDGPDSVDRLRLSLLHELAHAEGADHRFGPAATMAQAVWFFLPPIWWIRDQMKLDQEFLADRLAVAHFGPKEGYASSLVELAASIPSGLVEAPSPSAAAPEPAGNGVASALFQRVLMLVKCPFPIEGQTPIWWRWSIAVTIGLATLAASCLSLRGPADRSSSSDPAIVSPEVGRSIRLPQLVITARAHDDRPFDLRFRLPDRFSLTFEVLADPAELANLEVLGHRLGPIVDHDPARQVNRQWHRVEIRRVEAREMVRVDDRPIVAELKPAKLASWLTIRPLPSQPTRIRELELSW